MRALIVCLTAGLTACGPSFDRARWASGAGNACEENPRAYMISAAEHAGMRRGAPRAEIRNLLGEPDAETPTSDNYWLGAEPTGVDCHHMVIEYDANGLVDTITFVHG